MNDSSDLAGYGIKPLEWKFSEVKYHDGDTIKVSAEFWDSENYSVMRMVDERIPKIFGRVDISGLGGKLVYAGNVDIAKQMCEDHHKKNVMKLLMVIE